ncbi:MAG: hypothetical protein ED555_08370 [Allomuricauda sp.]|nr:MAG: hypothetical protein ED555_08370 [Allomuricauda sp.]
MEKNKTAEEYYAREHRYQSEIAHLRQFALQTEAVETCKWGMPVYTINNKNVFGICRFKEFFGIWFYNGALLSDPKKVLRNAQEGKTKAMRHWNFTSMEEIDEKGVKFYIEEAIANQKAGRVLAPAKPSKKVLVPALLLARIEADAKLKTAFESFSPYKQREFCEYIDQAKQETTKLRRLDKVAPMILEGIGLNDKYR